MWYIAKSDAYHPFDPCSQKYFSRPGPHTCPGWQQQDCHQPLNDSSHILISKIKKEFSKDPSSDLILHGSPSLHPADRFLRCLPSSLETSTLPAQSLGQVAHETSHSSEVMSKEFSFFHTISKYNIQILSLHWSVSQDLFCKSIASWLQKDSRLGKDRIHLGWLPEVLLFEQEEKAEGINTIIQSTFSLSLGQNFWVCLAAFA